MVFATAKATRFWALQKHVIWGLTHSNFPVKLFISPSWTFDIEVLAGQGLLSSQVIIPPDETIVTS